MEEDIQVLALPVVCPNCNCCFLVSYRGFNGYKVRCPDCRREIAIVEIDGENDGRSGTE